MAVITQLNQKDPNQDPNQMPQMGAATIPTVGGSQNASIAATGQQSPAAKVSSGRFTNLQSYLDANKGSGEKIAGKLGENVQKSADETQNAVQATGAVQSQLDAEKNRLAQASGFAQQVNTDPNAIANDQNKFNAFTQLRTGANSADAINNIAQNKMNTAQSALQQLQQNAANTATESGRFQLLQQSLGRPSYNQGQQRLDQLLVQNGGDNILNNLQKTAQTTAANANKTLATTNNALNTGVADVRTQAANASKDLTGAIGGFDNIATDQFDGTGAYGNLQKSLQQRQNDYIAKQQALAGGFNSGYATDSYSPEVQKLLGINSGQNLYDLDLKNYVNPTNIDKHNVSEQSVANSDDLVKYQALAKLAGTDPSYLSSSQIGTAGTTITDAQKQALSAALTDRQGVYAQDVAALKSAAPSGMYLNDQYDANGNPIGKQYSYSRDLSTNAHDWLGQVNQYSDPSNVFGDNLVPWKTALQNLLNLQGNRRVANGETAVNDNTFNVK